MLNGQDARLIIQRPPLPSVLRRSLPFLASLGVLGGVLVVNAILQPNLLTLPVIRSNLATFLPLIAAAVGQAIIVLSGGIDLSAGGIITLVNVVLVSLAGVWGTESGWSTLAAVLVSLLVAVAAGLLNGLLVASLRLQAIVATFATNFVWMGLALAVLPVPGGQAPIPLYRLYRASFLGIPSVVFLLILVILLWVILKRSRIGQFLYAVGGHAQAAFASGLPVERVRMLTYGLGGLFFGLAGVFLTADIASGDPLIGSPLTMNTIAAVVIGGTPLAGGTGGAGGAVVGAIVLGLIRNIIFFANVPPFYQDFISGLIIIAALALAAGGRGRRRSA